MTAMAGSATPGSEGPARRYQSLFADIEFDDDDDLCYEDNDDYVYNDVYGEWEPRPEWMHPDCADPLGAREHGTCCKYPADDLVRRALEAAEKADRMLGEFDSRDEGECARTAGELTRLVESLPALVAEIRRALPVINATVAAQLLCPVGRLILLVIELAGRSGCPMACTAHGAPDRRPGIAPIAAVLEECDEALWSVVLPRPRRRRGGV